MVKPVYDSIVVRIELDRASMVPLFRQLYLGMRDEIISRRLAPCMRLPPTRALADHLSIARNTVINAYEQLVAEGYLEALVGSGTRVASELPIEASAMPPSRLLAMAQRPMEPRVRSRPTGIFTIDEPALDAFPYETMRRLITNRMREDFPALLGNADPAGLQQLRKAVASYISSERGIACSANEVVITAGSLHGLDLVGRAIGLARRLVAVENPGDISARHNLEAAGATLVPIPVGEDGCDTEQLMRHGRGIRLACLTPSNQYPMGGTMPLARRLALLDWAGQTGTLIFEDDADSEFRYATRPLAPMKALDRAGVAVYAATFSRILMPQLRLGYLVLPQRLVEPVITARQITDRHPPPLEQVMVADFIERGHFAIHIRRMRKLYRDRQRALVGSLRRQLPSGIDVRPAGPGINTIIQLPDGTDDVGIAAAAEREKIYVQPLSRNYFAKPVRSGLLVGNALSNIRDVRTEARRLAEVLKGWL